MGASQNPSLLIFFTVTVDLAMYRAGSMLPSVISPSFLLSAARGILNETMAFLLPLIYTGIRPGYVFFALKRSGKEWFRRVAPIESTEERR
jgi:hypothetical protein